MKPQYICEKGKLYEHPCTHRETNKDEHGNIKKVICKTLHIEPVKKILGSLESLEALIEEGLFRKKQ